MPHRADAHIHLFENAYPGTFSARPGVQIDEAACYNSLADDVNIEAALVICVQSGEGTENNNEYVADLKSKYDWIFPAAFVDPDTPPSLDTLERWRDKGFVGLVMYPENGKSVSDFPNEIWDWMIEHRWIMSVNAKGEAWTVWENVLNRHNQLRLMLSHLGLPERVIDPITVSQARAGLTHQNNLARYPEVRVKLSGFYALTEPWFDYPHEMAWPYVEVLADTFGTDRLLWASDYTPCLNYQTVPQTLELLWKMPFLNDEDRNRIGGSNLLQMLGEIS